MIKNYFENVTTAEELKKRFHELVKALHPDNGGDPEEFKTMKAQYEKLANKVWTTHKTATGKTYEKAQTQTPAEFADMIERLRRFENITIEILGSWIWITGDTIAIKEELKQMHFFFSSKKKAWYFNGDEKKTRSRGHYGSYNDLKDHWGTQYSETTGEKVKITAQPELITA
jgi:DnaJ-class molecular chaperone